MIKIERYYNKFRVVAKGVCTKWMEENIENRHKTKRILENYLNLTVCESYTHEDLQEIVETEGKRGIVEVEGGEFRILSKSMTTGWFTDTKYNRKIVLAMLYNLRNREGKKLFQLKDLAEVSKSKDINGVYYYLQAFNDSGKDFYNYLNNKKKEEKEVIETVRKILRIRPLDTPKEIAEESNKRLGRKDIKVLNVEKALKHINCVEIRSGVKRLLEKNEYSYKSEYVFKRLFELASKNIEGNIEKKIPKTVIKLSKASEIQGEYKVKQSLKSSRESEVLFTNKVDKSNLSNIWETKVGWKMWIFLLYINGISQSVIGEWVSVDKSTVCRWLSDVAKCGQDWLKKQNIDFSGYVGIDEKFIKIGDCFWYLFAAVDHITGYPLHIALYPSNGKEYCQLFLLELKKKGFIPKIIITDGLDAYITTIKNVFPNTEHLLCRFHVVKSVFRRLRNAKIFDKKISKLVCKLFQTKRKRTVKRRIEKLDTLLSPLSANHVLNGLKQKLPQVIKAVGSTFRPSTSNCVERFFGGFDRIYKIKGPFVDQARYEREGHRLHVYSYIKSKDPL